ncbi:MAG: response regulator [Geminicoccaceae bacterium]|nr:MAG: response regulator [Geminicoccaceae bacterium]
MPKPLLLLVEDDPFDVLAMRRCVTSFDLPVSLEHAGDGEEALINLSRAMAKPQPPEVIVLLDLNMPRMNGIEFLDAIRADLKLARTIVFVLSTSRDPRDRRAAYARGVAAYICKDALAPDYADLATLVRAYVDLVTLPQPGQP